MVISPALDRRRVAGRERFSGQSQRQALLCGPQDLDVIAVHDATSPSEIIIVMELGVCPGEDAAQWIDEGWLEVSGQFPTNTCGLAAKGHPIGATGLGQVHGIFTQLRGAAGPWQVEDAKVGLTHNGGGILGVDAAAMAIHVFKR